MNASAASALVTLTLNPSLDLSSATHHIAAEHKLRCDDPNIEPGGGGVNVARAATRLGTAALAVLTAGGHTGDRLLELLAAGAIPTRAVPIEDLTRQSVTISERSSGGQYRFVFPGPTLSTAECESVTAEVCATAAAEPDALVVLSGSLPPGVPPSFYGSLTRDLVESGSPVIGDCSGPALAELCRAPALLVKPSRNELNGLAGRELHTEDEVIDAAVAVLDQGECGALVVSLGPHGALLITRDHEITSVRAPSVRPVSAVGAGDSMVAAMAIAIRRGDDLIEAVRYGVAAGTAAVLTPGSELCPPDLVAAMAPRIRAERVS